MPHPLTYKYILVTLWVQANAESTAVTKTAQVLASQSP